MALPSVNWTRFELASPNWINSGNALELRITSLYEARKTACKNVAICSKIDLFRHRNAANLCTCLRNIVVSENMSSISFEHKTRVNRRGELTVQIDQYPLDCVLGSPIARLEKSREKKKEHQNELTQRSVRTHGTATRIQSRQTAFPRPPSDLLFGTINLWFHSVALLTLPPLSFRARTRAQTRVTISPRPV